MKMPTHPSLTAAYDALVLSRRIKDDSAQRDALAVLQALLDQLNHPLPRPSWLGRVLRRAAPTDGQKGLYIWGNVGRGKSMLMDLFFEHITIPQKRRIHFHSFMLEIHARMHQLRLQQQDPVIELVRQIASETRLLCFDELQATDVADATLLLRLFSGLFDAGVTIVSTSNHPPASLYTGGVQRERFAKFIALIESNMQVMALSSHADYRHVQIKSLERVYFSPLGSTADTFIQDVLQRVCDDKEPTDDMLSVQGRITRFRRYNDTIGYFTFAELCSVALGASDYLAIAKRLKTVILTDIPLLTPENRNEAKRFVTLIDILYEQRTKLICTAAATPEQLYIEGDGAFEFKRTVSRLAEMGSQTYLNSGNT
jgi:cell division protein ZapE